MTRLQQFLLVGLLPAGFLLLAALVWRARLRRRELSRRWMVTLLTTAVWASSIMSYYVYTGYGISLAVPVTWRVVGAYAFSLTSLTLLLTTHSYVGVVTARSRVDAGLGALLWLAAFALDPVIWRRGPSEIALLGRTVDFLNLWGAVWVASWLIPLALAWSQTRQTFYHLPISLYRNQIHYWWAGLTLFFIGGVLALARDQTLLGMQEAGALVTLLAAAVGTVSLVRSRLPNLQDNLRRVSGQAYSALLVFGLTWLLLWLVQRSAAGRDFIGRELGLVAVAALFAFVVVCGHWLLRALSGGLSTSVAYRALHREKEERLVDAALPPAQVGQSILKLVERRLAASDAWLFTAEDGPGGQLILRPLAANGRSQAAFQRAGGWSHRFDPSLQPDFLLAELPGSAETTGQFGAKSPFSDYLRRNERPLIQHDLDALDAFSGMPADERMVLARWGRVLYMPLHAGRNLVGLLALGEKTTGRAYDEADFAALQALSAEIALPLYYAQALDDLRQVGDLTVAQNRDLTQENQRLRAQDDLYGQFMRLISPELRRPFAAIDVAWRRVQDALNVRLPILEPEPLLDEPIVAPSGGDSSTNRPAPINEIQQLNQALVAWRTMLDNLIAIVPRIQLEEQLSFEPVRMDEVCRDAIQELARMAQARQVTVTLDAGRIPTVIGDEARLGEAVRHLLHNAIKFNRIGGGVQVDCRVRGNEIHVRIVDNGVGIPRERLSDIWTGFRGLDGLARPIGQGLGLGLPLTSSIVRAHGGRVAVESKHGAGSTFSLYLPVEKL